MLSCLVPLSVLAPQSPQAVPWVAEHGLLSLTHPISSLCWDFLFILHVCAEASLVLAMLLHEGLLFGPLSTSGCQHVPLGPSLSVTDAGHVLTSIPFLQWVKVFTGRTLFLHMYSYNQAGLWDRETALGEA